MGKNLGEVDLGATCKTIHPTTDHEERLKEAKDKAETLQNELDAIAGKQVTMTVDYVPDPEVTHFTSTPEWQAALKEYNDKKAELDAQPAIVDALQEALDEQQKLHTQMVNKCRCTAQTALSGSMAINNDPAAIKQHQDDYSKAKELLCVLDDQTPCQYEPLATVVVPTLPADVASAVCTTTDTSNDNCPAPAAYDSSTTYAGDSSDNYYNYCNYMVTADCADMCTHSSLSSACKNECSKYGHNDNCPAPAAY